MGKIQLTEMQRAAVENRGGSLLVSAAAGSGKTKILVERLFRYMRQEQCNVDDFLIITYTKAAAAELRGKIAAELNAAVAEDPSDTHLRRQLLRVYQADIKTIDAFCTALVRENVHLLEEDPSQACLTPEFRVLDENEAQLLRERVLRRTLVDFYEQLTPAGELLADTLGHGRDDRTLIALVLELYAKVQSHAYPERWLADNRASWERFSGEGSFDETPYAAVLLQSIRRKADYWQTLLRRACGQMTGCEALEKAYLDRFAAVAEAFGALSAACTGWDAAQKALGGIAFPRLGAVRASAGCGALKEQMKKLWDGCKEEYKDLSSLLAVSGAEYREDLAAVAPAMTALLALTERFSQAYQTEKLRQNAADFSDQEHLALRLLVREDGTPTEVGEQITSRYREVLVDEYQDTNEVQNHIFRAVSGQGQRLFAVGDVKQSIYRFRLADPTIFLKKYRAFRPFQEAKDGEGRKILLSQNFRSRREILDAANFIFGAVLSPEMGDMAYGEEEALHFGASYYPPRTDCDTEFHLISVASRSEEVPRPVKKLDAETRFVAGKIRELLSTGYPVTEGEGLRPCRPDDFAILMRAPGSRAAAYAAALAEQGIPCGFESGGDFFGSLEISVILALLDLVDNPRQDIPLIAVLRSPLVGFSPDQLARIRACDRESDFYTALEADDDPESRAFVQRLGQLRLFAQGMSVERLLWHIYNSWNVLGIFGAMDGGARRRENLMALTEHAAQFESSGYRGLFAFMTQLHRLEQSGRLPQTRSGASGGGVQLMSIHKSKGLEFPIVFLCDLDHGFSRQDFDTPVLVHPELGLGPKRVDLARKIQYPTAARLALSGQLSRENLSEELRILYVAMTRPKEKLFLVDALYHARTRLEKLAPLAGWPALPESVAKCKNYGEWILLPLLCRPEAEPLRQLAGLEEVPLYTGPTAPWKIVLHEGESFAPGIQAAEEAETALPREEPDLSLLERTYAWQAETTLPAKLTATQLKGRERDREIAEQAPAPRRRTTALSQPRFRQESRGLTPAEAGTATHLALQYLDFQNPDVAGQIRSLTDRRLLSPEQAEAVDVPALQNFLASSLADAIRGADQVWREYPFTLLVPASGIDPAAASDDRILLQGIVDCCFAREGEVTVVDFKTDRVFGAALEERAEQYRPQLEAYSYALAQVLEKPVRRKILYFLRAGKAVSL